MDLALLAAREAAGEKRVDLRDAGRERPPSVVLAPQRRLVGLQPAGPQQVLESALALRDARGSRRLDDGESRGAHEGVFVSGGRFFIRFLFA